MVREELQTSGAIDNQQQVGLLLNQEMYNIKLAGPWDCRLYSIGAERIKGMFHWRSTNHRKRNKDKTNILNSCSSNYKMLQESQT